LSFAKFELEDEEPSPSARIPPFIHFISLIIKVLPNHDIIIIIAGTSSKKHQQNHTSII
jgi:hypothetical protein